MFFEQNTSINLPHLPSVPSQQHGPNQLQPNEQGGGFLEQNDESEHGGSSVQAKPQTVAKCTHHALLTPSDERVPQHHHQAGAGRDSTQRKHCASSQNHIHGKVGHN